MYIDRSNSISGVDWVDLKLTGLATTFTTVLKKRTKSGSDSASGLSHININTV